MARQGQNNNHGSGATLTSSPARLFGTDGIRGVANMEPITSETSLRLGRALAHVFKNTSGRHRRILIGKDTRLSGYMLETAMASGICSMGVDVLLVGPLPTPAIAFLTRSMRVDAGVVISASHNPFQDNGIKFFSRDGYKLDDQTERRIEHLVFDDGDLSALRAAGPDIGKAARIDDAIGRYLVFLKSCVPRELTFEGLKIVIDCANGAAYKVGPEVLEELGAEVVPIGVDPDGVNINESCGAVHLEKIREAVIEHHANLGVALDGDGDRALFVDERGELFDGDDVMAVLGRQMSSQGLLKHNTVVATVMSNFGLELALSACGAKLVRTDVGDPAVVREMRANSYNLGGEQSGHIIFMDHSTTGDGLITALLLFSLMVQAGKPLSELRSMRRVPQVLKNVYVRQRIPLEKMPEVSSEIAAAENRLKGCGRLLVRYSGTEMLARVMVEGEDPTSIGEIAHQIAAAIDRQLGVNR
ncbi:MAG TPA: phosphoglucosamine mutase [Candidatus Binataceae bacterium]|nr:phosphoglucosamine mutase [Candidatus Binataceae bacterium]